MTIEIEGRELARIVVADPGAAVPQYPGWTLDDLLYHTTGTLGRTVIVCRELAQERVHSPRCPGGMRVPEWYEQTLGDLLAVFRETDPTTTVWGFGPDPTIGFWERRMAIETGVHRRDAAQAAGAETPLLDLVAVSGLDEFAEMWLPYLGDVQPLTLTATDLDRTWRFGGDDGTQVRGTASDIYLRLMARSGGVTLPEDWARAVDGLAPPPKPHRC
ncbi:MAG: maleylpyruvate isomerase family mycothiol-dependent enzyme [Actinobacteria bacterium]|nr:maleylpyruvate isomerase family mycothiol-dependent enzyme [Actinomycetota bacterium]